MKHIWLCALCLLSALAVSAQEILSLSPDPAVTSGTLPNGMAYYIVSNPTLKGMADFAVVQRTGPEIVREHTREEMVAMSQMALGAGGRLLSPTVQGYFTGIGTIPGRNGFVEVTDNATIFRFEDVMLHSSPSVMDSTLLAIMEVVHSVSSYDGLIGKWYAPSDHAVIVSGDVDATDVAQKMKMLSYMIPAAVSLPRTPYVWKESENPDVRVVADNVRKFSSISAKWRLQRTPRERMHTIQPVVYGKYMSMLGIIAKERIEDDLTKAGVPIAGVSYDYVSGVETLGDEFFEVSVALLPADLKKGVATLASVMSQLDARDVRVGELNRARFRYMDELESECKTGSDNSAYVDRCISAYICNSSLASCRDIVSFLSSRELSDSTELALFNSIVSTSIDRTRNLVLECRVGEVCPPADEIREIFESAWDSALADDKTAVEYEAVPSLPVLCEKVKVRSSRKEYLSGGMIWTLSNGFKVVLKNMPADGRVYYALALNGGYGSIPGLNPGEGAYVSEIFNFSRIGGVDSERFVDVLRQNGMTLDFKVMLSTTQIKGYTSSDGMDYLVRALLAVMNDRSTDRDAFSRFLADDSLRREFARGSREDRIASIDSILCPGYRYTSCRIPDNLTDDFPSRVDKFMDDQSSKMNDGVLILVGDIDERKLKSALLTYAGGFRTEKRAFLRQAVNYQPVSGTILYTKEGSSDSVDMVISTPLALTADNFFAAALTAMALRSELSRAVAGSGMWLTLYHNCTKYPQERFNLMLSLEDASIEGFIPGTARKAPIEALNAVRHVLAAPDKIEVPEAELSSYKEVLKRYFAQKMKRPEYWLNAISLRYLDGKDFTTGYDEKIDAVTEERINELAASLADGSRVEYIINRRQCTTEP